MPRESKDLDKVWYTLERMFQEVAKEHRVMAKKSKTPTFQVELPVVVEPGAAKRLHAHCL